MKKRILAMLMAAALCVSSAPFSVWAEESEVDSTSISVELEENDATQPTQEESVQEEEIVEEADQSKAKTEELAPENGVEETNASFDTGSGEESGIDDVEVLTEENQDEETDPDIVSENEETVTKEAMQASSYNLSNPRTETFKDDLWGYTDLKSTWDCVYFGNYPQSDSTGAEKEPIKWRVLSVNGNDAFLLADQSLDCQKYNTEKTGVTWESCTLRAWLNNDFYGRAFNSSEQSAILTTTIVNEDNPEYGTAGGRNTQDKIYLLSISEVKNEMYGFLSNLGSNSSTRWAKNTAYAQANGANPYLGIDETLKDNGFWWLRSIGDDANSAMNVSPGGYVYQDGSSVSTINDAIRPALHLDLSSSSWTYAGTVSSRDEGTGTVTPTPTPAPAEEIRGSFKTGKTKEFTGDFGFCYKNSYFDQVATEYNQSLATMSLCMAFSAYGDTNFKYYYYDNNIKELMKKCGFCKNINDVYGGYKSYSFNEMPSSDSIACAIGSKTLPSGTPLIAIAVRGGGYESEWANNFTLGYKFDHNGFDDSAEMIIDYLTDYIQNELPEGFSGNIKIWITGFSRGAAVATQTAAKLNTMRIGNCSYDKDSIYAYGFATPAGACKESNPHGNDYNNIFNICDFNDPVPLVAPEKWGFSTYGITKTLPYEIGDEESNLYTDNMEEYMKRMGYSFILNGFSYSRMVDSFYELGVSSRPIKSSGSAKSSEVGIFNRKLVNAIVKGIGSREKYYIFTQPIMRDFGVNTLGHNGKSYDVIEVFLKFIDDAVLNPIITSTAVWNKDVIAVVHSNQEYYIAWMQSMDPNYKNSLPLKWGSNNYRAVTVNCPVDVYVYDSNNEIVASIIDEKPTEIEDSQILSMIDENDQKTIYLPVDETFEVKVVPRDNCEVSYNVDEYGAGDGKNLRRIVYSDVDISKGQELLASVGAFTEEYQESLTDEGSNTAYELKSNEKVIEPTLDLRGNDEMNDHTYEINVTYDENQGTIYGAGSYLEGSFVKLIAENKPDYDFEGFYVGDKKLMDDDLDDSKYSVRIEVKNNTDIEARFGKCEHEDWSEIITKKPTTIAEGEKTYTCVVCGKKKTESIPKIQSKEKSNNQSTNTKVVNTLTVKGKTAKVKYSKLKKKKQTVKAAKAFTVSGAQGKVTYKLVSVKKAKFKKYFKVSKAGKITIKKGLKKGTYKLKVKVTAAGNANYKPLTKSVTVKIKVK